MSVCILLPDHATPFLTRCFVNDLVAGGHMCQSSGKPPRSGHWVSPSAHWFCTVLQPVSTAHLSSHEFVMLVLPPSLLIESDHICSVLCCSAVRLRHQQCVNGFICMCACVCLHGNKNVLISLVLISHH